MFVAPARTGLRVSGSSLSGSTRLPLQAAIWRQTGSALSRCAGKCSIESSFGRCLHAQSLLSPRRSAVKFSPASVERLPSASSHFLSPPGAGTSAVQLRSASTSSTPSPSPATAKPRARHKAAPKKTENGTGSSTAGHQEDLPSSNSPIPTVLEINIRRHLELYPGAILLTQVGSFFESYFDQAPLVAKILGIKLSSRLWGKGAIKTRLPTCGFPIYQLDKHASTLIEAGQKVVVVEEFWETPSAKTPARKVTRIITAGTGVDDSFVKEDSMNFVLAVGLESSGSSKNPGGICLSLAYRDVSTGAAFHRDSTLSQLRDDILLIEPREVVVDERLSDSALGREVFEVLRLEHDREPWFFSTTSSLSPKAEDILDSYLAHTLISTPPPRIDPTFVDPEKVLQMDSSTINSLEIRNSLRGGQSGSLLGIINKTVTPGGARLLAQRLSFPSTEEEEINKRLSLVATFKANTNSRLYLRAILSPLDDTSRVLQRLSMRRGTGSDLLSLKRTLSAISQTRAALEDLVIQSEEPQAIEALLTVLQSHGTLAALIDDAIDEDAMVERTEVANKKAELEATLGPTGAEKMLEADGDGKRTPGLWGLNFPWVIKTSYSSTFKKRHEELALLRKSADELESSMRKKYDSQGLALKDAPKLGPIVHVLTKSGTSKLDADSSAELLSRSGSTRGYVIPAWSSLYAKIEKASGELKELEQKALNSIIVKVMEQFLPLHESIAALDEVDVALGFAEVADAMRFVRPTISQSTNLNIIGGRHPIVEHALELKFRSFSTNSLHLSHPSAFLHCLTGPNMAGKSTFLRQNALIVVLAQAGSFVPAESAEIGIVDKLFSRVGARDELDRDKSTFRIEMDETASILTTATDRSLVLLDELGRGTSPLEGVSIAFAALESLVQVNRSRTLFATHYHRLGDLMGYDETKGEEGTKGEGVWEGVEFWCTDYENDGGVIRYSHEVRRGLNNDSGGINIARSAGLPERTVAVAEKVRSQLLSEKSI